MISNPRDFACVDPFESTWNVKFLWQQVGIAIRHADTIDCKFILSSGAEQVEKVIAFQHADLKAFSKSRNREITDAWVMNLAAEHLRFMIESGEDMDKTLVTLGLEDLERSQRALVH